MPRQARQENMTDRQLLQLESLLLKFIWEATPSVRIPVRNVIASIRRRRGQQERRKQEAE